MAKAKLEFKSKINEIDGMTLVWVPSGSFMMGAPVADSLAARNEKPQVKVEISKGFWICNTPVTQEALAKILGANLIRSTMKGDKHPATDISLTEIFAYCDKVRGRLPTEAEWEWAARAGSEEHRPAKPKDFGWYNKNAKGELQAVAQKKPNAWGLYDVMGNVCEMTSTPWSFELVGGKDPGLGDKSIEIQRTIRSGSFANAENMMSATARSGHISQNKIPEKPFQVQNTHGFRYVLPE